MIFIKGKLDRNRYSKPFTINIKHLTKYDFIYEFHSPIKLRYLTSKSGKSNRRGQYNTNHLSHKPGKTIRKKTSLETARRILV